MGTAISSAAIRHPGPLDWLRVWIRHRRKALQYRSRVPEMGSFQFQQRDLIQAERVLFTRNDRLGDWVLSLPLLLRLRSGGRRVMLRIADGPVRDFLAELGFETVSGAAGWNGFQPDLVLVGEPSRHLRSPRHPARLEWLHGILELAGDAPTILPCIWRSETGSIFPGSYAPVGGKVTASGIAGSLGDWLRLPGLEQVPPLAEFRRKADEQIVFNLSAGNPGGQSDRLLPVSFWLGLRSRLEPHPVVALVQPGDEDRLVELRQLCRSRRLPLEGVPVRTSLHDLARWLGERGILVSPETGLCHLARMMGVPAVVMSPRRLIPFWYQPSPSLKILGYRNHIAEVQPAQVEAAVRQLQGEIRP